MVSFKEVVAAISESRNCYPGAGGRKIRERRQAPKHNRALSVIIAQFVIVPE
jgi:hypothetical protein